MTEATVSRVPGWYWAASGLALLWTLFGVAAYLMQAYGVGAGGQTGMTEAQRQLDSTMPAWVMGAYAIAVFAGAIGCVGLLLRKRWAKILLLVSLIAVLAQQVWVFLLSDAMELLGQSAAILPIVVILVSILLVWFADQAGKKGWLS